MLAASCRTGYVGPSLRGGCHDLPHRPCHPLRSPDACSGIRQGRRGPSAAGRRRASDPPVPGDVIYGFGRIDCSGRVADRAATSVLGWRAGDRLTLTAAAGVVTARRGTDGMVTMIAKPYVAIPAALRRRCGPSARHAGSSATAPSSS